MKYFAEIIAFGMLLCVFCVIMAGLIGLQYPESDMFSWCCGLLL